MNFETTKRILNFLEWKVNKVTIYISMNKYEKSYKEDIYTTKKIKTKLGLQRGHRESGRRGGWMDSRHVHTLR